MLFGITLCRVWHSGVNNVQVVLSGLSMRWLSFVHMGIRCMYTDVLSPITHYMDIILYCCNYVFYLRHVDYHNALGYVVDKNTIRATFDKGTQVRP